jgi:DNA-binding transcriptional regulator PaaX
LIARFNRERLDREMNNVAKPILQRTGDVRHGQRVEAALRFVAGPDRSFEHVLWVKNYDRVVYRSPRWPAEIAPENYPPPTSYAHGLAFTTPPRRHRRAG